MVKHGGPDRALEQTVGYRGPPPGRESVVGGLCTEESPWE